jgi:hypothetical protein
MKRDDRIDSERSVIQETSVACHSERLAGAKNLVFEWKIALESEILRRYAPQNDMIGD